MTKRNIRVVKWLGAGPAVALCTGCNREFRVALADLKTITRAQESLKRQFAEHSCEPEGENQSS